MLGWVLGIPGVSLCMERHKSVKTDSPRIEKLARFVEEKAEPVWRRVYLISSYVFFSHRAHLEAGAKCETCHGPVKEREVLWRETQFVVLISGSTAVYNLDRLGTLNLEILVPRRLPCVTFGRWGR